jgi:hypothetical protein
VAGLNRSKELKPWPSAALSLYSIIEYRETPTPSGSLCFFRDLVESLNTTNARIPHTEIPSLVGRHASVRTQSSTTEVRPGGSYDTGALLRVQEGAGRCNLSEQMTWIQSPKAPPTTPYPPTATSASSSTLRTCVHSGRLSPPGHCASVPLSYQGIWR